MHREFLMMTSFCLLLPFFGWASVVKSSWIASTATLPPLSHCLSPSTLSDKRAIGDISVALRNGMGTVLPAEYMDQSYRDNQFFISKDQICSPIEVGIIMQAPFILRFKCLTQITLSNALRETVSFVKEPPVVTVPTVWVLLSDGSGKDACIGCAMALGPPPRESTLPVSPILANLSYEWELDSIGHGREESYFKNLQ